MSTPPPKKDNGEDVQDILNDLDSILSGLKETPAPPSEPGKPTTPNVPVRPAEPPRQPPAPRPQQPPQQTPAPQQPPAPQPPQQQAPAPEPTAPPQPEPEPTAPPPQPAPEPTAPPPQPAPEPRPSPDLPEYAIFPPEADDPNVQIEVVDKTKGPAVARPAEPAAEVQGAAEKAPAKMYAAEELLLDPEKVPPAQVRRLVFAYAPGMDQVAENFVLHLTGVAKKMSKKPLYIHAAAMSPMTEATDISDLIRRTKELKGVGILGVFTGFSEAFIAEMEEKIENEDLYFQSIAQDSVGKRLNNIDLVVELMLLKGG